MKRKSNKSLTIIIVAIVIMLILVLLLSAYLYSLRKHEGNDRIQIIKGYTSVSDFKSVEEVCIYLDCTYIKTEKSTEENYSKDFYINIKLDPFTDNNSNEAFYNRLVSFIAEVQKFESFRIIDTTKKLNINVVCDTKNKQIKSVYINGESNYFSKIESLNKLSKYTETKETELTVKSSLLNEIIKKEYRILDSNIGTKESTFDGYDIFFDEGIEVRKVSNKVFNIVFNVNYKDEVLEGVKTTTTKENIVNKYGTPTFEDELTGIIGYKGKDIYVFINVNNKEISVYPNYNSSKDNIYEIYKECKDKNKTGRDFIYDVKEKWPDYDINIENESYILVQYALRGIKIQYNVDTRNGLIVYNNYEGTVYEGNKINTLNEIKDSIPEDIYMENSNLIQEYEQKRISRKKSIASLAIDRRDKENKQDTIESKLFVEYKEELSDDSFSLKFISLDGSYANSELRENADYGLWITDRIYVYSVGKKGIYAYDAVSRKYLTLTSGKNQNYEIKGFKNKTLIYDNNEQLKLNV